MVGHYPNKSTLSRKDKILLWMQKIITEKRYLDIDDIHLDEIDIYYKDKPHKWVDGSLRCFEIAIGLRNQYFPTFSIGWAFSLRSKNIPIGLNFRNDHGLIKEFCRTPPSLYIFENGDEPWLKFKDIFIPTKFDLSAEALGKYRYFYSEFLREDGDYSRNFWMAPCERDVSRKDGHARS